MFIIESNWLIFDAAISTTSLYLFYLPSPTLCSDGEGYSKHVLFGGFLWLMFFQWILDLVASDEWFLRSLKPYFAKVFVDASFLYCPFSVIFQVPLGSRRTKKEGVELMFLFFRGCFVPCCPSFILAFVFLNIY